MPNSLKRLVRGPWVNGVSSATFKAHLFCSKSILDKVSESSILIHLLYLFILLLWVLLGFRIKSCARPPVLADLVEKPILCYATLSASHLAMFCITVSLSVLLWCVSYLVRRSNCSRHSSFAHHWAAWKAAHAAFSIRLMLGRLVPMVSFRCSCLLSFVAQILRVRCVVWEVRWYLQYITMWPASHNSGDHEYPCQALPHRFSAQMYASVTYCLSWL